MTFSILDIEKSSVEKYLSNMVQDSNHRFKSWEYCYTCLLYTSDAADEL